MIASFLTRLQRFSRRMRSLPWLTIITKTTINHLSFDLRMLQENLLSPTPLFKKGEVVFIKASPKMKTSAQFPAVGSPYEIDCKVLAVSQKAVDVDEEKRTVKAFYYSLITGHGHTMTLAEEHLIPAKDIIQYRTGNRFVFSQDTELAPAGAILIQAGDYYVSDELGLFISVARTKELAGNKVGYIE